MKAICGLKQMPVIRYEKLLKLKEKDKPDAVIYFCNECGTPTSIGIYCCAVDDEPDKGLSNFTKCCVWFTTGMIRRIVKKKKGDK